MLLHCMVMLTVSGCYCRYCVCLLVCMCVCVCISVLVCVLCCVYVYLCVSVCVCVCVLCLYLYLCVCAWACMCMYLCVSVSVSPSVLLCVQCSMLLKWMPWMQSNSRHCSGHVREVTLKWWSLYYRVEPPSILLIVAAEHHYTGTLCVIEYYNIFQMVYIYIGVNSTLYTVHGKYLGENWQIWRIVSYSPNFPHQYSQIHWKCIWHIYWL